MSEYIKREDIKNAIRERFNSLSDRVEINTVINMMPTIDIVRCKECYMCDEEKWCSFYDSIMESDDFCSYGEREGE